VASPAFDVGDYVRVFDPSRGDERWYINDHTIFRDEAGVWHLVGITHAEPMAPLDEVDLAHATADRLAGPWTAHAPALTADPAAGETHLWAPHVVHHAGAYWMFYCGGGGDWQRYAISVATSTDAWTWTRHQASPLIVDGYQARDPMVLRVDGRWLMYYTATLDPAGGPHIVAAAESDDLLTWRGRHVVYEDAMTGTEAGPTESPFVVARPDAFYLFIGPDWKAMVDGHERTGKWDLRAYRRTRVFRSTDPLRFRADDLVGTIDSHAAEVVIDEDGAYWVTHCGWGQGGVYLAPLRWRS
jgi:beta-fructofuranosidase